METISQMVLSLLVYKVVSLLVGAFFCYLGYRLFLAGIVGHAGHLAAEGGGRKFVLKDAAPGTFFAFFGAAIITATIYKGLEYNNPYIGGTAATAVHQHHETDATATLPPDLPF